MSLFKRSTPPDRTTPPAVSEEDLLARIAGADRVALAALYQGCHGRLYRFLSRHTRRQHVIDEVINDTFLVVWQKAAEFRGQSRASTWIMGIAYRCMLKHLRDHRDMPSSDDAPEAFGLTASPEDAVELHDWLDKGLARLSPEQRDALELAYGFGHSLEEIAEITGSAVGTVKTRMFHARTKLANLLPGLGGERKTR